MEDAFSAACRISVSKCSTETGEVLLEGVDLHREYAVGCFQSDGAPPTHVVHGNRGIKHTLCGFVVTPGIPKHDPTPTVCISPAEHRVAMRADDVCGAVVDVVRRIVA